MQRVNGQVCAIRCARGTLIDDEVVNKILRSFPTCYSEKVAAIENFRTIRDISREDFPGRLCAYEMTTLNKELPKG